MLFAVDIHATEISKIKNFMKHKITQEILAKITNGWTIFKEDLEKPKEETRESTLEGVIKLLDTVERNQVNLNYYEKKWLEDREKQGWNWKNEEEIDQVINELQEELSRGK